MDAGDWRAPLPEVPEPSRVAVLLRESGWVAGHLAPWLWGRLRGRPPEVPPTCKRPELLPVTPGEVP